MSTTEELVASLQQAEARAAEELRLRVVLEARVKFLEQFLQIKLQPGEESRGKPSVKVYATPLRGLVN
jgi:hypothetical protein